jgi:hypothetical protein
MFVKEITLQITNYKKHTSTNCKPMLSELNIGKFESKLT